jgi:hypothetical protein
MRELRLNLDNALHVPHASAPIGKCLSNADKKPIKTQRLRIALKNMTSYHLSCVPMRCLREYCMIGSLLRPQRVDVGVGPRVALEPVP